MKAGWQTAFMTLHRCKYYLHALATLHLQKELQCPVDMILLTTKLFCCIGLVSVAKIQSCCAVVKECTNQFNVEGVYIYIYIYATVT